MSIIFIAVSVLFALVGGYFVVDFVLWRIRGTVVRGTLLGFKAEEGKRVAFVSFEDRAGEAVRSKVVRIDQFLFYLNRPAKDDPTTIIYQKDQPSKARIYGYIYLFLGGLLCVPFMFAVAHQLQNSVLFAQLFYVLIFGAIILGGWVLLKLIQRYY